MRNLISTIIIFTSFTCFSQNTIKITFENKVIVSKAQLKDAPKAVQDMILKQFQSSIVTSTMYIQEGKVFYESKSQTQDKTVKGNGQSQVIDGKVSTLREVNSVIESPENKYLKNSLKNTYTEMINGKLVTKNLEKTIWKITNNTKKIAGYNCIEATGIYKGKSVSVFYTKELNAKGSPDLLPFTDGVILEYNTGTRQGIAIKVELNQPNITDFFKTK